MQQNVRTVGPATTGNQASQSPQAADSMRWSEEKKYMW